MLRGREHASQRVSIMPSRNSEKVCARKFPRAIEQAERHATPETPAPEVTLRQSFGRHVMIDDEVRQVHSFRALGQQTSVKFLVFARQQTFISAAQPRRIWSNAFEHRPRENDVSAHQNAGIAAIERDGFVSAVNPADDAAVLARQPFRERLAPAWHVWTTDEIQSSIGECGDGGFVPTRIDLFVVVDNADEVAARCCNAGVQRVRSALLLLEHILDFLTVLLAERLDHLSRAVSRVIVDRSEERRVGKEWRSRSAPY